MKTADKLVLSLRGVTKTFGAQRALDSVDLDVRQGEVHAVVGQNGSGKSTIVKLLGGYHTPDPGSDAAVRSKSFELGSATAAADSGLRFVHQDLGLIDDLTVSENFFMMSDRAPLARISKAKELSLAGKALTDFGYDIDPAALVSSLTPSQRTAVAIVRAMSGKGQPELLILDEPTASLAGPAAQLLFDALRRLTTAGGSVLFISHHLDEVLDLADTITVMRDGRKVTTLARRDLDHDRLVELMLGRALTPRSESESSVEAATSNLEPRLSVRGLEAEGLRSLNFDVRPGEVVGIAGLTGSGREEIAGAVAGQTIPHAGKVLVDGTDLRLGDPAAALIAGLGYVPAERRRDALLTAATLRENLTISNLRSISRGGILSGKLERRETQKWIEELDVRPPMQERLIDNFSGGNQQKVVIGRLLRTQPKVIVLDEPTQGVDIGAKATIHDLVISASTAGAAVLVCSSDVEELVQMASRVLVVRRDGPATELVGTNVTVERIEEEQIRVVDANNQ